MTCSYPGHSMAGSCPPGRVLVEAPPDRLGRTKTFQVCENALVYAQARGYTVLQERTCPRHELNLIRPAKRWVYPRQGCPYSEAAI